MQPLQLRIGMGDAVGHNTLRSLSEPLGMSGKAELLGVTAQQLRVPLTTLQLHLQLLARTTKRASSVPSQQLAHKLQLLNHQAWRMSEIIEGADDLARVLQGALQADLRPTPAELGQLVQALVERLGDHAREQECELVFEHEGAVWGEWDVPRLQRILAALIQNALSYAPHSIVHLAIEVGSTYASIEVRDGGVGISEADLARLDPALPVPSRTKSGAGVGLWMASQVAAAMGGALKGERFSEGNARGSRFRLTLPLVVGDVAHTSLAGVAP